MLIFEIAIDAFDDVNRRRTRLRIECKRNAACEAMFPRLWRIIDKRRSRYRPIGFAIARQNRRSIVDIDDRRLRHAIKEDARDDRDSPDGPDEHVAHLDECPSQATDSRELRAVDGEEFFARIQATSARKPID